MKKTNIVGGVTNEADLTNNNIGVVSNGDDTLTVKLKKDVDLGANGSLKTGAKLSTIQVLLMVQRLSLVQA